LWAAVIWYYLGLFARTGAAEVPTRVTGADKKADASPVLVA
jgi:hypothetical protein